MPQLNKVMTVQQLLKRKIMGRSKEKYITTVAENNDTNAASVDISGKIFFIETKN